MIETDEAVRVSVKPTHAELERAIASVPGVEEAHVTLLPDTGRSRLRIRLANGEDAPTVSWAISATLRERFGIVLDPGAIRPKLSVSDAPTPSPNEAAPEAVDEPTGPPPPQVSTPTPPGASARWRAPGSDAVEERPGSATDRRSLSGLSGEVSVTHQDGGAAAGQAAHGQVADDQTADDQGADATDDDPIEGKVVVIGDRVQLNEAARAVLAESLEASPQPPLEGTTGPVTESLAAEGPAEDDHPADALVDEVHAGSDRASARSVADPGSSPSAPAHLPETLSLHPDAPSGPATTHHRSWSVDQGPVDQEPGDQEPADQGAVGQESAHPEPADHTPDELEALRRGQEAARAAIRHLDTQIDVSDVRVTATLAHGGRSVTGEASSVPTRKGILRAVAEATVSALRQLTGDRLVVGVDSVVASVAGEPPMATVLVGIITEAGEETLLGSSLVRQDPERAVMRATLDALNRRVEPWLEFDLTG